MEKKPATSTGLSEVDRILQILDKNQALKQRVLYRIRELKRAMRGQNKTPPLREQKEIRLQQQQHEMKKKKS